MFRDNDEDVSVPCHVLMYSQKQMNSYSHRCALLCCFDVSPGKFGVETDKCAYVLSDVSKSFFRDGVQCRFAETPCLGFCSLLTALSWFRPFTVLAISRDAFVVKRSVSFHVPRTAPSRVTPISCCTWCRWPHESPRRSLAHFMPKIVGAALHQRNFQVLGL